MHITGMVKGESLNVALPPNAFDSPPGTVFQYGANDTIPKVGYTPDGKKRQGQFSVSHPNGQTAIKGTYIQGVMNGACVYYDSTGDKTKSFDADRSNTSFRRTIQNA